MIRHDSIATCHDLYDATERGYVLGHFHSSGLAFLSLRQHGHRELRISQRVARELSHLLDYFARHERLPTTFPQEDFMI